MTDKPAAFYATYSDWRLIKTRKVVQIVLEVPLEASGRAYDVLGGMPNAGSEVWCAVARLKKKPESETILDPPPAYASAEAKKSWHQMKPAQQAGILCNELSFLQFLRVKGYHHAISPASAAEIVRKHCNVTSRSEIAPDNNLWRDLVSNYRAWMHEPEVVG